MVHLSIKGSDGLGIHELSARLGRVGVEAFTVHQESHVHVRDLGDPDLVIVGEGGVVAAQTRPERSHREDRSFDLVALVTSKEGPGDRIHIHGFATFVASNRVEDSSRQVVDVAMPLAGEVGVMLLAGVPVPGSSRTTKSVKVSRGTVKIDLDLPLPRHLKRAPASSSEIKKKVDSRKDSAPSNFLVKLVASMGPKASEIEARIEAAKKAKDTNLVDAYRIIDNIFHQEKPVRGWSDTLASKLHAYFVKGQRSETGLLAVLDRLSEKQRDQFLADAVSVLARRSQHEEDPRVQALAKAALPHVLPAKQTA